MMSHPNATPAPRYAVTDVEELMTCAAAILAAVNDGTLDVSATIISRQDGVVQMFDRTEQALDRLRQATLDSVPRIRPEPPRAACMIDLPIDDYGKMVAVVCNEEFNDLCANYFQSPADVLAGFVADACGVDDPSIGYVTGGSDERDQASAYIERRYGYVRFAMEPA